MPIYGTDSLYVYPDRCIRGERKGGPAFRTGYGEAQVRIRGKKRSAQVIMFDDDIRRLAPKMLGKPGADRSVRALKIGAFHGIDQFFEARLLCTGQLWWWLRRHRMVQNPGRQIHSPLWAGWRGGKRDLNHLRYAAIDMPVTPDQKGTVRFSRSVSALLAKFAY